MRHAKEQTNKGMNELVSSLIKIIKKTIKTEQKQNKKTKK